MKRRIPIICICFIIALFSSNSVIDSYAGTTIDTDKSSSMTIRYSYNGETFSGLDVNTYKIATVSASGKYTLCGPFSGYPVDIDGVTSQIEWNEIASTLAAYVVIDHLDPTCEGTTDVAGITKFLNIEPGMYLTMPVSTEKTSYGVAFDCFLTAVPFPDGKGNYNYDVSVYPKGDKYDITPDELNYSVIKQWKDLGFAEKRPDSVRVDIYNDDTLMYQQELSGDNNWSFSWSAPDDGSVWHVIEYDVPPEYTVRVVTRGETIIVTNTYEDDHEEEPPTEPSSGDEPTTEPPTEPSSSDEPTTEPPTEPSSSDEPTTESVTGQDTPTSEEPTTQSKPETESGTGEKVPQTGDTTSLWTYVFAMCISGTLLLILAMWRKRAEE